MSYPGGKAGDGTFQAIINQIPPHKTFIEPFAGSAAIARMKRPAAQTILIEKDEQQAAKLSSTLSPVLPGLTIVNACALEFLKQRRWQKGDFVYLDPPYMLSARSSTTKLYNHPMDTALEHRELIAIIRRLKVPVMLSGYSDSLYELALADWRTVRFTSQTRGGPREEGLWMNYPEPVELHDYSYLGADYRERECIKRQVKRWVAKLQKMPRLRRLAMAAAIAEYNEGIRK